MKVPQKAFHSIWKANSNSMILYNKKLKTLLWHLLWNLICQKSHAVTPKWFKSYLSDTNVTPKWSQSDPEVIPKSPQSDAKLTPIWHQSDTTVTKLISKWPQSDPNWFQRFHGYQQISMDIYGYPWKSRGVQGYP